MAENTERNLRLLRELISCAHDLCFQTYDTRMNCVYSSLPDDRALSTAFVLDAEQSGALDELREGDRPVAVTGALSFLWIADPERDASGELLYIHVIGPVFVEDVAPGALEAALERLNVSAAVRHEFRRILEQVPVIPLTRLFEYGLMLHYCITGEKITASDIRFPQRPVPRRQDEPRASGANVHGTWAMEQKLLRLVEEGNPNIKREAARLGGVGSLANLGNGSTVRHFKNITIVFTALCTRAAIRGGLDPEIAYTLSDRYINAIEAAADLSGITEVNAAMQEDFALRVHRVKLHEGVSPQIRKCCDFIQLHPERSVPAAELAACSGYSESHLARKFKRETGMTIAEYTMQQKIELAESLLRSERKSVQEVAEQLGFHSQSYFGQQFKKITGRTPGEYRNT